MKKDEEIEAKPEDWKQSDKVYKTLEEAQEALRQGLEGQDDDEDDENFVFDYPEDDDEKWSDEDAEWVLKDSGLKVQFGTDKGGYPGKGDLGDEDGEIPDEEEDEDEDEEEEEEEAAEVN